MFGGFVFVYVKGIVYCDFKLVNVFFSWMSDGIEYVKLFDFGFVCMV